MARQRSSRSLNPGELERLISYRFIADFDSLLDAQQAFEGIIDINDRLEVALGSLSETSSVYQKVLDQYNLALQVEAALKEDIMTSDASLANTTQLMTQLKAQEGRVWSDIVEEVIAYGNAVEKATEQTAELVQTQAVASSGGAGGTGLRDIFEPFGTPEFRAGGFGLSRLGAFASGFGLPTGISGPAARLSETIRAAYGLGEFAETFETIAQTATTATNKVLGLNLSMGQFVTGFAGLGAAIAAVYALYQRQIKIMDEAREAEEQRLEVIQQAIEALSELTTTEARQKILELEAQLEDLSRIRSVTEQEFSDLLASQIDYVQGLADLEIAGSVEQKSWQDLADELQRVASDAGTAEERIAILNETLGVMGADRATFSAIVDQLQLTEEQVDALNQEIEIYNRALGENATAIRDTIAATETARERYVELSGVIQEGTTESVSEHINALELERQALEYQIPILRRLADESKVGAIALAEAEDALAELNSTLQVYTDRVMPLVQVREAEIGALNTLYEAETARLDRLQKMAELNEELAGIRANYQEKEQDAIKATADRILDLRTAYADWLDGALEEIDDVEADFNKKVDKLEKGYMDKRLEAWRDFLREQRQNQEEHDLDMLHRQQDYYDDMYDAAADNDVVRFKQIERDAERELRQQEEKFQLEQRHRYEDFLDKIKADREENKARLKELRDAADERIAAIRNEIEERRIEMEEQARYEKDMLQQRRRELENEMRMELIAHKQQFWTDLQNQAAWAQKRLDLENQLQGRISQVTVSWAQKTINDIQGLAFSSKSPYSPYYSTSGKTSASTPTYSMSVPFFSGTPVTYSAPAKSTSPISITTGDIGGGLTYTQVQSMLTSAADQIKDAILRTF